MPEFLTNPAFYLGALGLSWGVFTWAHKLSRDAASDLIKRICTLEDTDKVAYPQFQKMLAEHAALYNTVTVHHEQRFQGIVAHAEKSFEIMDMKVANHDKDIREIKDCITKLEQKFDKNTDRIIEQITRLTEKIH